MTRISAASIRFGGRFFFEKNNKLHTMKPWIQPKRIMVWRKLAMMYQNLRCRIKKIKLGENYVLNTLIMSFSYKQCLSVFRIIIAIVYQEQEQSVALLTCHRKLL